MKDQLDPVACGDYLDQVTTLPSSGPELLRVKLKEHLIHSYFLTVGKM